MYIFYLSLDDIWLAFANIEVVLRILELRQAHKTHIHTHVQGQ